MAKKTKKAVESICLPQFKILDLFAITTAVAVGFATQELELRQTPSDFVQGNYSLFRAATRIVFALTFGLPLAGVFCFRREKYFNKNTLIEPGYWLLFSMFFATVDSIIRCLLHIVVSEGFFFNVGIAVEVLCFWSSAVTSFCSACILLFAARRMNFVAWRIVLCLCASLSFVWFCEFMLLLCCGSGGGLNGETVQFLIFLGLIETLLNIVIAASLIVLTFVELKNEGRRSLWHWLGLVSAFLAAAASEIVRMLGTATI